MTDNRRFCGNCGHLYPDRDWPRTCAGCSQTAWKSPEPVACLIPTVYHKGLIGAMIGKRAIDPCAGGWSLIGGYVERGEVPMIAALREFSEETYMLPPLTPEWLYEASVPSGNQVLMFYDTADMMEYDYVMERRGSFPSAELLDIDVVFKPVELCFSTHTEALEKFFRRHR